MFGRVDFRKDGGKKKWVKIRRENFLEVVWLGERERKKKMIGFGVFSLRPPKSCLPKMERKLLRGVWFIYEPKCPCALAYGLLSSTFSFFLFSLDVAFSFLFFFIYFLTRSDFFFLEDFYFFNKFGWLFFFFWSLFLF